MSKGDNADVFWSDCLRKENSASRHSPHIIGVLPGEGIGSEVIGCALQVLSALEQVTGHKFEVEFGTVIGREAERACGKAFSGEVMEFCGEIFARGGAVLSGPGGGRYVYELRRYFDLFCKINPLKVSEQLISAIRLKPECVRGVDILIVRENSSGIYQGVWKTDQSTGARVAEHRFAYTESEVKRILRVAAKLAKMRRGELTVVYKEAGLPSISDLWQGCAREIASGVGVCCSLIDIDHMAYRLVQHPHQFDVIVAPNLFGDVLSDLGSVLLGSRGLSFAGSFAENGAAVYSTNHGAAYDLAGTDRANPVGQILSLGMLLEESFHLRSEARLLESAVARVWREGWRTADLSEPRCRVIGTREMGNKITWAIEQAGCDEYSANCHPATGCSQRGLAVSGEA